MPYAFATTRSKAPHQSIRLGVNLHLRLSIVRRFVDQGAEPDRDDDGYFTKMERRGNYLAWLDPETHFRIFGSVSIFSRMALRS